MNETCPECQLRYERAPGYFLGSMYINYGATALTMTVAYVLLHFQLGIDNRTLMAPLLGFCIIFPVFAFRYSRALWLGFDCFFDLTGFENQEHD